MIPYIQTRNASLPACSDCDANQDAKVSESKYRVPSPKRHSAPIYLTTSPPHSPPSSPSPYSSSRPLPHSPPFSSPSARNDDQTPAAPPPSHYCLQTGRKCSSSSVVGEASAHRLGRLLQSPLRERPGRGFRCGGTVALRSGVWRASGGRRGSGACLPSGARRGIGGGRSRGHCLGWGSARRCPRLVSGGFLLMAVETYE